MKKNLAIISAVLILALSASGCVKKTDTSGNAPQSTAQTDVSDAYSQPADMSKVPGDSASSDNSKEDYSGKLGDYEVTIEDAKIVDNNGEEAVVVSFNFKNKSNEAVPFSGVIDASAYQNEDKLTGTVITNVEGVNMIAIAEHISKGESITVQQAYTLRDKSLPLVVEVREFGKADGDALVKTFKF